MTRKMLLSLLLFLLSLLAFWFLTWGLLPDGQISEYEFSVLGDSLRNLGGVAAVLAASAAAYIAHRTNESRRVEAIRANFKDRMQWAVTHLNGSDQLERTYAESLLTNLAADPLLEPADRELARKVLLSLELSLDDDIEELIFDRQQLDLAPTQLSEQLADKYSDTIGKLDKAIDNESEER